MSTDNTGPPPKGRPRQVRRLVETALLMCLHSAPAHGYGLLTALKAMGLEDYPLDSSVVYRALRELERCGAVTSAWHVESTAGPPRRVYRLTPLGERMLSTWVVDLRETARALNTLLAWYDDQLGR